MIDLPPINVYELLQSNIIQTMASVFISVVIGMSQKNWVNRILYSAVFLLPMFFVVGTIIDSISTANWKYIVSVVIITIGTWVVADKQVVAKKGN